MDEPLHGPATPFMWAEPLLQRIDDPAAALAPAAQRMLAGAMRVIANKGFGNFTLASLAAASRVNVAAVKYYFGSKAGLLDAVVDAVLYAEIKLVTPPPAGQAAPAGLSRLARETLILSTPGRPLKVLFELLPHALRDKKLRAKLRDYYSMFYALHLEQLGAGLQSSPERRERMKGLAMLLTAIADGLTIQELIDAPHFDMVVAMRALDDLLAGRFADVVSQEAGGE